MGIFDVTLEAPIDDLFACPDEDVGQLLELDDVVGKGGFATVWRAAFDGHLCACKVLQPRGGNLPPAPIVRLFIRECISLMSMEHSAVIRCAGLVKLRRVEFPELGLSYDTYGMLLEFCEGGTLKDLLLAQLVYGQDQYSIREALGWLGQVASALQQFHSLEMPIIHRDIKPENVLLQLCSPGAQPGFWEPSPQQQQAGYPRKRMGTASGGGGGRGGGGSFRPCTSLDAKLADLGLGVRVCANRSVLIRRRTTPVTLPLDGVDGGGGGDRSRGPAVVPSGGGGGEGDDEAIQTLLSGSALGGGGGGAAAAAAGLAEVRMPFMGFTTTPCKPPKRQASNPHRRAASARLSAADAPDAVAAGGGGGGSPDVASLYRTTLLNNVRARLSGTGEGARHWGPMREAAASGDGASGGSGGSGGSPGTPPQLGTRLSLPSPPGRFSPSTPTPPTAPPPPPPAPQGGALEGAAGHCAAAAAAARDGDVGGGQSAFGPSPFRDFLKQQQQHKQKADDAAAAAAGAGGAGGLAPIPERSFSAEDTAMSIRSGGACSGGTLAGAVAIAVSSGTAPTATATTGTAATEPRADPVPQMSVGRPPGGRNPLDTIQEPEDYCPPPLPTAASAPATAGAPRELPNHHHLQTSPGPSRPNTNPNDHRADIQPRAPHEPHDPTCSSLIHNQHQQYHHSYSHHHPQQQQKPPQGGLLAAAAAGLRSSLRRAAAAAAAALSLSGRPGGSGAGRYVVVDVNRDMELTAGEGVAALNGGGGGLDSERPVVLQASTSLRLPTPTPICRIDLGPEEGQDRPPQSPQQQQQRQRHQRPASPTTTTTTTTAIATAVVVVTATQPPGAAAAAAPGHPQRCGSGGNTGTGMVPGAVPGTGSLPRTSSALTASAATATANTLSSRASKDRASPGLSSLLRPNLRELRHSESLSRAMRKVGSLLRSLNIPSLPKFRRDSSFQWVYGLTGQAGSCMYMAPEVFRGEPYNEKVDVHSFGVMMYELLARDLLLVRYIGGTRAGAEIGVKDPQHFAKKVCEGFRPPRHPRIPEAVWQLIQACWHPDPLVRPDMAEVAALLETAAADWDWQHSAPTSQPPKQKKQQQQQKPKQQQQQQQERNHSQQPKHHQQQQTHQSRGGGSNNDVAQKQSSSSQALPQETQQQRTAVAVSGASREGQAEAVAVGGKGLGGGGRGAVEGPAPDPPGPPGCRCVIS
ncbi:hypothetical protein PLESTB_001619700 [Pleodorina starrii]|uniref:Protein kinase domain-containing protein n=1 Tax=Pleodorina starrii TaxID=330485 RepID=A0A9W6BXQ6_9CHLO|nr:hypothetical protein PLESTM_001891300 [Pleodorina starrii]GLC60491.1 hypothetical protein PLESTB_001619700 [Pleodorina starrii]GLC69954.1 hypothetical protein PLESTF_000903500 [Pleodorina starrii]